MVQDYDMLCDQLIVVLAENLKKKLKPAILELFKTNPSHEFTALDLSNVAAHMIPGSDETPTDFVFKCEKTLVKKVKDSQKKITSLQKEVQLLSNKLNVAIRKIDANNKDFSSINREFHADKIETEDKFSDLRNKLKSCCGDALTKSYKEVNRHPFHQETTEKIKKLENDLRAFMSEMDKKYDAIEQYTRRNTLVIRGVTYKRGENTNHIVLRLFNDMGLNIMPFSIDRTHRNFGKPGIAQYRNPPVILVKFVSHDIKDYVYTNRNVLRRIPGCKHIFINENLTVMRRDLYRDIRHSLTPNWNCSTYDGNIYLTAKNAVHCKPVKITCRITS